MEWAWTSIVVLAMTTLCCATKVQLGESITMTCSIKVDEDGLPVQLYKEEMTVKAFRGAVSTPRIYISDNAKLKAFYTNHSDQYVLQINAEKLISLTIINVTAGDAGAWGCHRNVTHGSAESIMETLEVEGPVLELFWVNKDPNKHLGKKPNQDYPGRLMDKAVVTMEGTSRNQKLYCVVVTTTTEPEMHFTLGRYGEEGTTNARRESLIPSGSVISSEKTIMSYETLSYFTIHINKLDYMRKEDLYCRASTNSSTMETYVRLRLKEAPKESMKCEKSLNLARPGAFNFTMTCKIDLYPKPTNITWLLPDQKELMADCGCYPSHTASLKESEDGNLLAQLTIEEVNATDFGQYTLSLTNELGKGEMTMELMNEDEYVSGAIDFSPSAVLPLVLLILLSLLSGYNSQ